MPSWHSVAVAAALLSCQDLFASAHSHSGSEQQWHHIQHRAPSLQLDPIHPTILRHAEGRLGSHIATGDYIMQGLSGTMTLVNREYGLRNSESFYWGPNGNPIANLTAYADGKAVRVLSLERFDDVLENAQCGLSSIRLTFTKEVQFDAVQDAWQWVNDADENYIILITESAQCNIADGDQTVRQPWHVTKAAFDDDNNVVTLDAEPRTWSEAFSNWRLKVNSRGLLPAAHTKRANIDKRLDIKFSPNIDLGMDFSNSSMSFGSSEDGSSVTASMTCVQCETHGSLDFDIDIIPHLCDDFWDCVSFNWDPYLEGHIEVVAEDIGATVEIKTSVSGAASFFKHSETIFSWNPPIGRIYIPGVLDIGPQLKFVIAADIGKVESKLDLTTGLQLAIPPDAIYYLDVHNSSNNQISSWTPSLTPLPPSGSGSLTLSSSIGGELHLDFSGTVMSVGTAELGVFLAAPTFNIKASMFEQSAGGACGIADADFGANLDVGIGMSLNGYEEADLEFAGDTVAHVGATQTLWTVSQPLYTTCVTLDEVDSMTSTPAATPGPGPAPTGAVPSYPVGNGTTWNPPYATGAYVRRVVRP